MNLSSALLMLMLITGVAQHLVQTTLNCSKGMLSFVSYATEMLQAETKLVHQEKRLITSLRSQTTVLSGRDQEKPDATGLEKMKVIGFVPDHLEFNCEQGVFVVKLEAPPLQTYWALPFE